MTHVHLSCDPDKYMYVYVNNKIYTKHFLIEHCKRCIKRLIVIQA